MRGGELTALLFVCIRETLWGGPLQVQATDTATANLTSDKTRLQLLDLCSAFSGHDEAF